jgi:hypothetical protein
MIVLFVKTPSTTWRVQVATVLPGGYHVGGVGLGLTVALFMCLIQVLQAPVTAAAIRAVVAEQHGVPAARQRYFLDAELRRPAKGAALAGLSHGATVHFREAAPSGDDGDETDEEAGSSSSSSSDFAGGTSERHEQAQLVPQPRTGESAAGDFAARSPLRVADGAAVAFTDADASAEASPHERLVADGDDGFVTRLPVRARAGTSKADQYSTICSRLLC